MTDFNVLTGKTLVSITGLEKASDEVIWTCTDGTKYQMYHSQDCCETVDIEDIEGDKEDLLNSPVVMAEEVDDKQIEMLKLLHAVKPERDVSESGTWTYYRIGTVKGMVVIRWLGESNGYYSEAVYFEELK